MSTTDVYMMQNRNNNKPVIKTLKIKRFNEILFEKMTILKI